MFDVYNIFHPVIVPAYPVFPENALYLTQLIKPI